MEKSWVMSQADREHKEYDEVWTGWNDGQTSEKTTTVHHRSSRPRLQLCLATLRFDKESTLRLSAMPGSELDSSFARVHLN